MTIMAVVGGQYGSEGKGNIVNHIASAFRAHVRTGGPNAGHSFQHPPGRVWKQQVVPVGWTNPDAHLVLGRGGLVPPGILAREIAAIREVDPGVLDRVYIDAGAGLLLPSHHRAEGGTEGDLHERIGSTGEGVGAARIGRIQRDPNTFHLAGSREGLRLLESAGEEYGFNLASRVTDTVELLVKMRDSILLEGTQGSGLSLIHGEWPYVTSHDTGAAQLAADAGIPPHHVNEVLLVLRTFPIRVAGNSGPLPGEITWDDLSRRVGMDLVERTTVTNKVRRIAEWSWALVDRAVMLNGPTALALNFIDYLYPDDAGITVYEDLSPGARGTIRDLQSRYRIRVRYAGTGGPHWSVVDVPA